MSDLIGKWTYRAGTKAHLVESPVAERVVVRCGKELPLELHGRLLVFVDAPTWSAPACKVCSG